MFGLKQIAHDIRSLREGQAALKTGLDQVKQDVAAMADMLLLISRISATAAVTVDNEAALMAAVAKIADIHTSMNRDVF